MRRREFLAAATAGLLSCCRRTRRGSSSSSGGGGIVEVYRSAPESFDPTIAFSDVAYELFGRIYSGLLRYDGEGRLVADLALNYESSSDAIRLILRETAKWHDGRPVIAADIIETMRRYSSKDYPFSAPFASIGKVDVARWPEVVLRLNRPSFALLHALTARVLPSHISDLGASPIGCGFYKVQDRFTESLTLRSHPSYYGQPAMIDRVECRTVPDPMSQYLQLLSGDADLAELSADFQRAALRDPKIVDHIRVFSVPSKAIEFLFFNVRRIADPALRQAIAQSINRDDILRYLYWGNGRVVSSPFLEAEWNDPEVTGPAYDPRMAASLLDSAGYDRRGGTLSRAGSRIRLTILFNADSTKRGQIAQVIAQSLTEKLGIDARVQGMERGLFERLFFRGDYECAVYGFSFAADPDDVGNLFRSDSEYNVSGYADKDVDDLFARGRDLQKGEEKRECYRLIQRILAKDLPSVPLLSYNIPIGVSRRIDVRAPSIIGDTYRFTREENLWRLVSG